MGILEDLLNSAMTGQGGMGQPAARQSSQAASGDGMGGTLMALLPVVLAMLSNRGGNAPQPGLGASGGGLGDILGQVLGGGARQGGGGLGDVLGGMLGGGAAGGGAGAGAGAGGLGGLLEQMARAGYGNEGRSWVGTGQNMPIAPEALEQIFGRGGIGEIARQAGVSEAEASRGLSELLPEVVDRVTPGGEVPDLDSLAASVGDLSRQFGLGR